MNPAIKPRLLPYVAVLLFVLFKIPHTYYPFYWDESWVYAPAVRWMYVNGISILPGAIPVDFSRGHPLFFHCACAFWMNIFGTSNCAMHCFALFVSIILIICLFECTLRLFGLQASLISLALLLLNMDFFVASSFVLTDIMLALFAFLAIYTYAIGKHLLTLLFLALVVFTKESGAVACVVIGVYIFAGMATKGITLKTAVRRSMVIIVPVALFLLFFAAQKHLYGWYLFPGHTSAINLDLENTMFNVQRSLRIIFYEGHAYMYYALLAVLAVFAAVRQKEKKYWFMVLYLALLYTGIMVFSYKDVYWYILMAVTVAGIFSFIFYKDQIGNYGHVQTMFLKLLMAFCIAYIYFSSINFFEGRYLFPALFLLSVLLLAVVFVFLIAKAGGRLFAYVLTGIACVGLYDATHNDLAFAPYMRMDLQQQLVDFMEENNFYDKHICCPPYVEARHLADLFAGFLRNGRTFRFVDGELDPSTELAIFDNMELRELYNTIAGDTSFMLLKYFEQQGTWIKVYARK